MIGTDKAREDRVMGALDVATKPIQFAQGMVLIIKAIVIALVLLLGLPIYLLVTGQPVAFWQIEAFGLTLMLIYTFCCTPYYVLFGAPLGYCILWSDLLTEIVFQDGRWALSIFLYLLVGILIHRHRKSKKSPEHEVSPGNVYYHPPPPERPFCLDKDGNDIYRQTLPPALDGEQLQKMKTIASYHNNKNADWYRPGERSNGDDDVIVAEGEVEQLAKEVVSAGCENAELANTFAEMVSDLGPKVVEMMRACKTVSWGNEIPILEYDVVLRVDVLYIVSAIAAANGTVPDGLARLYLGIVGSLNLLFTINWGVSEARNEIAEKTDEVKVRVPVTVKLLSMYDTSQKTTLAAEAAVAFCSLIRAAAEKCTDSTVAVKMVADRYIELLEPHLVNGGAQSHESSSSTGTAVEPADGLSRYYSTLGVRSNATPEEVKQAYRDLVKVWHPDRFAENDTRLKQKAEEQLKAINDAYVHIREHQPPSSSDIDIEKMPLQQAVVCITAEFKAINGKALLLCARIATAGVGDRDDVCLAVGEDLAMLQSAINRLQRLIRRFEREVPSFPRTELESLLTTFMQQRAEVIDVAVRAGFIEAR
jgi:hypothetical protein